MKPLLKARLASYDGRGFTLGCGDDLTIRVVALAVAGVHSGPEPF